MIKSVLAAVGNELKSIGVPYAFMRWGSPVDGRYWVGEYSETPTGTEDGYEEATVILTGTTQNEWLELLQDQEKIEDHFPAVGGLRISTDKGAVVIFYGHSFPVPTGEASLKRLQVNLQIKAWKGMK